VLASNRGGIPELIPPDGGWIFDPDDPQALRGALRRCIESREQLALMAPAAKRWAQGFNLATFTENYVNAYRHAHARANVQS
jgi:glycosyltransferase involved in cell wall biosynthesis